jgi:hypothetical protein
VKQRAGRRAFRQWLVWSAAALALGLPCASAQTAPEVSEPTVEATVADTPSAAMPEATPTSPLEPSVSPTATATAVQPTPMQVEVATPIQATHPPSPTPTPSAGPASPTVDFFATRAAASPPAPPHRPVDRAAAGEPGLERPRPPSAPPPSGFSAELLLSGALVGLLSALFGYGAARLGQGSRRRQARAALATAMLAELGWLDGLLRAIVEQGAARTDYPVDHPIIEASLRDLTLFRPETAARIAQFHDLLRSLGYEMTQLRDNPRRWTGRIPEFDRLLKARAAMACRAVPGLLKQLRAEGGQPPPPLADRALDADPGELPPKPFATGESDDWTL